LCAGCWSFISSNVTDCMSVRLTLFTVSLQHRHFLSTYQVAHHRSTTPTQRLYCLSLSLKLLPVSPYSCYRYGFASEIEHVDTLFDDACIRVWICSTKYVPLFAVCMKFYRLLLNNVMICVSVQRILYYPKATVTFRRIPSVTRNVGRCPT